MEDELSTDLVFVRLFEHLEDGLHEERKSGVRGGGDADGSNDGEAELGRWTSVLFRHCAEGVEEALSDEIGRTDEESFCHVEFWDSAYKERVKPIITILFDEKLTN